jgi:hypothetical protein
VSEACSVVARVEVCASGGSATAIGLDFGSGGPIIVPLSAFFPSLAATLCVTRVGGHAFDSKRITSVAIPRHVQFICSSCFSHCKSLSSISFEIESELTRIELYAFYPCSSLKSITIPRHVQFVDGSVFSTISNISISAASDNLHFVVK